jgi:hypothetical protein
MPKLTDAELETIARACRAFAYAERERSKKIESPGMRKPAEATADRANDVTRFWWPGIGYWPIAATGDTVRDFIGMFQTLGYEVCPNGNLEAGYERIAIYAVGGQVTHAARQLSDGTWTGKLGREFDVFHTLPQLEATQSPRLDYGTIAQYLRRPTSQPPAQAGRP